MGSSMAGGGEPGHIRDQLLHVFRQIKNIVKFQIICVPCDYKMKAIRVLGTDNVKGMIDVVEKKTLFSRIRFGVDTTQSNIRNLVVVCDISEAIAYNIIL